MHAHAFANAGSSDQYASPATDMDAYARAGAGADVDAYAGSADQYASPPD